MKKISIILILSILMISGCSSSKNFRGNRLMNLSEEERQKLFEERQQKAIEACQGKNQGDVCKIQTPRGELNTTCKTEEGNLMCISNYPMRQRQ